MNEPVQEREFSRAIATLTAQLDEVKELQRQNLAEARKTNGRVSGLERARDTHHLRLETLEEREPVTKRDLWLVGGALGAAAAGLKWLPALVAVGEAAR